MFGLSGCLNSSISWSHRPFAVLWSIKLMKIQPGSRLDRRHHMALSFCFHSLMAWLSIFVGWAASFGMGHVVVLSKWPQRCMACMASWKHMAKTTQFTASSWRYGMVARSAGRDMEMNCSLTCCSNNSWFSYWARAGPITCRKQTSAKRWYEFRAHIGPQNSCVRHRNWWHWGW